MVAKRDTILLVDDSEFSLGQAAKILGDQYNLIRANNAAEGLMKLETQHVDLVITDVLMPHISGLAFLGQVRQRFAQTRVIVCSADMQTATIIKARELGAAAFVPKPLDADELKRVVRLVSAQPRRDSTLPLTPHQLSVFGDIFTDGISRAVTALSKLVHDTVKLSVPRVEALRPNQLLNYVVDTFAQDIAYVRQTFSGALNGTACLLLSTQNGVSLVNALLRQPSVSSTDTISEADQEMLVRVGDILLHALVGSLGHGFTADIAFSPGQCDVGQPVGICADMQSDNPEFVMVIETLFVIPGRSMGGNFVILVSPTGVSALLKGIDRLL